MTKSEATPESVPSWVSYLKSLADELSVQANRIRNLIGDSHWLTDGHHKEYLLLALLNRHLPCGVIASRGFVISPTNQRHRSKEQDILLVDTTVETPLFHQSDVIVTFPAAVIGSISVKTELDDSTLQDAVLGLASVAELVSDKSCWLGGYWFTTSNPVQNNASKVIEYKNKLNTTKLRHVSRHPNFFACRGDLSFKLGVKNDGDTTHVYQCKGLATGYFLANILDYIGSIRGASQTQFSEMADYEATIMAQEPDPSS